MFKYYRELSTIVEIYIWVLPLNHEPNQHTSTIVEIYIGILPGDCVIRALSSTIVEIYIGILPWLELVYNN